MVLNVHATSAKCDDPGVVLGIGQAPWCGDAQNELAQRISFNRQRLGAARRCCRAVCKSSSGCYRVLYPARPRDVRYRPTVPKNPMTLATCDLGE